MEYTVKQTLSLAQSVYYGQGSISSAVRQEKLLAARRLALSVAYGQGAISPSVRHERLNQVARSADPSGVLQLGYGASSGWRPAPIVDADELAQHTA